MQQTTTTVPLLLSIHLLKCNPQVPCKIVSLFLLFKLTSELSQVVLNFGGTCCLYIHLQFEHRATGSSETSVRTFRTKCFRSSYDYNLNVERLKNLKSQLRLAYVRIYIYNSAKYGLVNYSAV
jgi:hypothetical protein